MTEADNPTTGRTWLRLSEEARRVRKRVQMGDLVPEGEQGLDELLELGLIVRDPYTVGRYVESDLHRVERMHMERQREIIATAADRMAQIPAFLAALPRTQTPQTAGGIEFLSSIDQANSAITAAMDGLTDEVLTAHPHERPKQTLELSLPRDLQLLSEGKHLRTIYPESSRSRGPETAWAAAVTAHGAEVRTMAGRFHRLVIVDSSVAFMTDHIGLPTPDNGAFKVTHPGMIAHLRELYEDQWQRADPWMGGRIRPPEENVTTPTSRAILRGISAGKKLRQIAKELQLSERTLSNHLTRLYRALDVEAGNQFALGEWWASTDERKLD
ncbi:LuxR C-terminal-related transcriptional regulator [Streptomyces sp. CA-135486]|uniref:helix-turn-helix transcriptional regulator n=1 Tax=Streptomyces sp. CA-135486 TaxID=3240049 RepID=UPI003D901554